MVTCSILGLGPVPESVPGPGNPPVLKTVPSLLNRPEFFACECSSYPPLLVSLGQTLYQFDLFHAVFPIAVSRGFVDVVLQYDFTGRC